MEFGLSRETVMCLAFKIVDEKGIDNVFAALHLLSSSNVEDGDSTQEGESEEDNDDSSKKIQKKTTSYAQSVGLGMMIAQTNRSVVKGVLIV